MMALFYKKESESAVLNSVSLSVLSGQAVQVRTPEGVYLFNAIVQPVAKDAAYLQWYGGTDPNSLRAKMPDMYKVVLRYGVKETGRVLRAVGYVRQTSPQAWAMARMVLFEDKDERKTFRQRISFVGSAVFSDRAGEKARFQGLDISARGIGIMLGRAPMEKEHLLLTSPFLSEAGIKLLAGQVRYTITSGNTFRCGCEFGNMEPATESALSRLVNSIQSKGTAD